MDFLRYEYKSDEDIKEYLDKSYEDHSLFIQPNMEEASARWDQFNNQ